MSIKLNLPTLSDLKPRLTVIGIGGAGCNAINNMIASGLTGVDFVVANTDAQALAASSAEHSLQLGVNLTEGLGAGARPEIGQAAAEEAVEEIRAQISGSHMVFLAAGMGGGTGTGAAAVIARVAREQGILTVGVVTKPFHFEGRRRMRVAEAGIEELKDAVDTLIVIPNQNLFLIANENTSFGEAFMLADQVLYSGVACIVDLILKEGLINLDFADVRTVMANMGTAMMGTGEAAGENRAILAAEEAISNPLLDDVSLRGAKGLLLSITGGRDLRLFDVEAAASRVREEVDPEANIIVGATFDESLGDKIRVSIVASGMKREASKRDAPLHANGDQQRLPSSQIQPEFQNVAAGQLPDFDQSTGGHMPPPLPGGEQNSIEPAATDAWAGEAEESLLHQTGETETGGTDAPDQSWEGPGNVRIEAGSPIFASTTSPEPVLIQAEQSAAASGAERFSLQPPPQDTRRARPRLPGIEDFPSVVQHAYKANQSDAGNGGQEVPDDGDGGRPGLIDRLREIGRRPASDSIPDRPAQAVDRAITKENGNGSHNLGPGHGAYDAGTEEGSKSPQGIGNAVKLRRRSS